MARVARRESVTIEKAVVEGIQHIAEQHDIVAGCNTDALGRNRIPASCRCVADQCAMWRWEHTTKSVPVPGENGATCYEQRVVRTHGYCGLSPLSAN
jgi:hypothetical protein